VACASGDSDGCSGGFVAAIERIVSLVLTYVYASASAIITNQATTSPLQRIRSRSYAIGSAASLPPVLKTKIFDNANASIIFTFGSFAKFLFDGVFGPSKPTHVEAPPHHCIHASATPLLHLAGDLPLGGD
jgi:hypothetical protein